MSIDPLMSDPSEGSKSSIEKRREALELLERAAAALLDAEDHGPAWIGYLSAKEKARLLKSRADEIERSLNCALKPASSDPTGRPIRSATD